MAEDPARLERGRRYLARLGWASAAVALLAAAAAVAEPDVAGVLLLAALVCTGTAALFIGGPAAREETAFRLTVAVLVVAGAAGVALAVAVDPVLAVGVAYVAYIGALVIRARRRRAD